MNSNWTDFEIKEMPALKEDESSLLDMHSLLNVLSILHGELSLLGLSLAHDEEAMSIGLKATRDLIASLRKREAALHSMEHLSDFHLQVEQELHHMMSLHPEALCDPEIITSCDNIRSVFAILEVRAREIMARQQAPEAWVKYNIDELRANFMSSFSAIEKNSKGRYRILYNLARQTPSDYFIQLTLESEEEGVVSLPPVFIDVMRDLIANARKYTPQGGSVFAGLFEDNKVLSFAVEDTGRGIPASEIPAVVKFGKRGSNVGEVRTMGGGFGLTKALYVTKQFKGRLWIASREGEGTRIRIEIPRPPKE